MTELARQQIETYLNNADAEWINRIPYQFAKRHSVLVGKNENGAAAVISANKPTLEILTEIKRQYADSRIKLYTGSNEDFQFILSRAYDKGRSQASDMVDTLGDEIDLEMLSQEVPVATDLLETEDHAPIVRLINALLAQAVREGASDIHLEAFENDSVVRLRVDGILKDILTVQRALHSALVSRLKVMAKLDIAEKRLPQDGRISIRLGERPIDIRVSTLPTQHGERVVLRILDKQGSRLDVGELGMDDALRARFEQIMHTPHGIILLTGPTGSGKTTTLYAGLSGLNRKRLNILTIEDPVEYDLEGVGQSQVQPKIGMTFASGLRSILRQDPDVVLVGEIRDLETAQISVQASLTGHLVLSTLHTNTAIGAVTRLIDMGVEPFLIASSMTALVAQRLVRTLCDHCKQPYQASERELSLLQLPSTESVQIFRARGCSECDQIGYRGRLGIFEMIILDDELRNMIHDNRSESDMLQYVRQTTPSITRYGCNLVIQGKTSLDEVLRVTQEE